MLKNRYKKREASGAGIYNTHQPREEPRHIKVTSPTSGESVTNSRFKKDTSRLEFNAGKGGIMKDANTSSRVKSAVNK